ncbi:hypothetical protein VaNZ11_016472 [Volvox africanus]|uniref:Uncharacterized protein n=1 Tax=Volvox africanus TaxID=51714 RepID=A0ABQ5SPJ1_9CHLO|nr:hypothetical protein VaNZ11_016472 [Volvox africanus]
MLKSSTLVDRSKTSRPSLKYIPILRCSYVLPKQRARFPVQCPRQIHLRRVAQAAANPPGTASPPPATDNDVKLKKGFWTFVDVVAILGSVGGALAAILNLFSGTYVLFLPLVLPVISLLSALQREGLIAEDNRRAYDTLRVSITQDSNTLLAEARSAIEEVRRELRGQNTTAARLGTIEARLSSLEGSILSAGRSAREAAAGLGVLPERLQVEQRAVLEGLVAAMRVELRRAAESLANNETTALARLDARLAAVEGSLSGLEVAQSEGLRRLSMSLNSAMADAEATLQSSVRNEVARSMEPVRRLPQMLAAALPPALAAAEAVEASAAGAPAVAAGAAGAAGVAAAAGLTPEQLQAIVSQEVEVAVARILDFQVEAFGRLNMVRPVPIDEEQWSALGRRLTRLERLVEGVPAGTEGALLQGGQVPAAVAAAVGEALAAQVAEARVEVTAAAAREAESVRNDVLAAQTVLRESLDNLAAALQPLQLGVMELQVAVSAVSAAQTQQQQQLAEEAALHAWRDGEGGMVTERSPSSAGELGRLLEGVQAVTQLLHDVDSKIDNVTVAMAHLPAAATVPPSPAPAVLASDTTAEAMAAAAAKQQQELRSGIEGMKEALAALTTQVGLIANQSQVVVRAAEPSAPAAAVSAVVDVLSFEASLASAAPPEHTGGNDALSFAGTVGTTRDEAYDMMLQLAEARRRSGSEASVSGGDVTRNDVASGVDGGGGGGVATVAAAGPSAALSRRAADSQLRIEGLPPFEPPLLYATAGATATVTAMEIPSLPPSQREREAQELMRRSKQELEPRPRMEQQSQQQQQYFPARLRQEVEPQLDMRSGSAAATAAVAPPPAVAAAAPAAGFDRNATSAASDGQLLPYDGSTTLPYDQAPPAPALQAASSPSPSPFSPPLASSSPTPFAPAPQPPASPPLYPAESVGPATESVGYIPQGDMYGWDQRSQQQLQQQQLQQQASYAYDQPQPQPQPQNGRFQAFQEGFGYSLSPSAAAQTMGGLPIEQPPEAPSWYTMQQQQQPQEASQPPFLPQDLANANVNVQTDTQVPPQKQRQLRFPFWPMPNLQAQTQAAAPPPPPPPRASAHPPPPPQQPMPTTAGVEPRPAMASSSSPPQQPSQGFSPLPSSLTGSPTAPPTPSPQQPVRAAAPAVSVPPLALPNEYRPRPLDGLNTNEMITEGLRLLRLGREETRKGEDYGLADTLIQGAIAAFTRASEQPSADAKAMGNLGNALLARGELKAAYLETLRSGPAPATAAEATAQMDAERAMTLEANALLTEAGVMFLKVLEMDGWSSRALVNWGRALVIRADLLAATPDGLKPGSPTLPVVAQLYISAIGKFEGVLEGEPDMMPAKYRCALAMGGMSRTKPGGSRERLTLLADAINYLRDVIASQSPDAEALRSSAVAALQRYETQLMAERAARQQPLQ